MGHCGIHSRETWSGHGVHDDVSWGNGMCYIAMIILRKRCEMFIKAHLKNRKRVSHKEHAYLMFHS